MPTTRVPAELEEQILAMPGVLVNGKPVNRPAPEPDAAQEYRDEKAFMAAVVKFARELGWSEYHTYNSRRSKSGWPDLVLVRGERIVFVELKTETGRTTAAQDRWIELLTEAKQTVYVWRPSSWPQIKEVLA